MRLPKIKLQWMVLAALLLLLGLVFLFRSKPDNSPERVVTTTDKDTGETLVTEPNKSPETGGQPARALILGLEPLLKSGMTQAQFILARDTLQNYAADNLAAKYSVLKILPDDYKSTGTTITAKLKLGNDGPSLPITIKYWEVRYIQILIDSAEDNQRFDSGTLTVPTAQAAPGSAEDFGGD